REPDAPPVVEPVDRPHQAQVAPLDEVEERHSRLAVRLGHEYDETEVGLDELRPSPLSASDESLLTAPVGEGDAVGAAGRLQLPEPGGGREARLDATGQCHLIDPGEPGHLSDRGQVVPERGGPFSTKALGSAAVALDRVVSPVSLLTR